MSKFPNSIAKLKKHPVVVALLFIGGAAATGLGLFNDVDAFLNKPEEQQPRVGVLGLVPRTLERPTLINEPLRIEPSKLIVLHVALPGRALASLTERTAPCVKIPFVAGAGGEAIARDTKLIFRYYSGRQEDMDEAADNRFVNANSELCNFEEMVVGQTFSGETARRTINQNGGENYQIVYRFSELYPDKMAYLHFYTNAAANVSMTDETETPIVPDENGEITLKGDFINLKMRPHLLRVSIQRDKSEEVAGYVILFFHEVRRDADLIAAGLISADAYKQLAFRGFGLSEIRSINQVFWLPEAALVSNELMQEIFGNANPSIPRQSINQAEAQGAKQFLILRQGRFSNGCYRSRVFPTSFRITNAITAGSEWHIAFPAAQYIEVLNSVRSALIIQRQIPSLFVRMAEQHSASTMPSLSLGSAPLQTRSSALYSPLLAVWNGCTYDIPSPNWYTAR